MTPMPHDYWHLCPPTVRWGFPWNWQRAASIIKFATFQRSSDQWNGINCCQLSVAAFMPLNSKCSKSKKHEHTSTSRSIEKAQGKARIADNKMSLDRCIGARVQLNLGIAGGGHSVEVCQCDRNGDGRGYAQIHSKKKWYTPSRSATIAYG